MPTHFLHSSAVKERGAPGHPGLKSLNSLSLPGPFLSPKNGGSEGRTWAGCIFFLLQYYSWIPLGLGKGRGPHLPEVMYISECMWESSETGLLDSSTEPETLRVELAAPLRAWDMCHGCLTMKQKPFRIKLLSRVSLSAQSLLPSCWPPLLPSPA